MKFFSLIFHIITSTWKNATPSQAILITAFMIFIIIIAIISVVQVLVPFTYIAI